jgi:hypothetical protein
MDKKTDRADSAWPIVDGKEHEAPSVFRPEALLREARRQRRLPLVAVPEICVLDPDGDVVRHLKRTDAGRTHEGWACYHTELLAFDLDSVGRVGIVGCAVGAPFAVLVAEQLFASGCRLICGLSIKMESAPELLAAAYELLGHTAPFDKWNLPEPDDIEFRVSKRSTRGTPPSSNWWIGSSCTV